MTSPSDSDRARPFTHWQLAGLLLLRGRVQDYRHGKPGGPADGDTSYTIERPSGLILPLTDPDPFPKE